jgi:hypothetical protein
MSSDGSAAAFTVDEARLDASELTSARLQVLVAAVLSFLGNLGGALLTSMLYGGGLGNSLRYAHASLSAVVIVLVMARPPSRRLILGSFAALTVPILPLLVVWTLAVPEAKLSESFIAFKMVVMGLALLTPLSLWLGLSLLAGFSIEVVTLWGLGLSGRLAGEPWVTLFYAVFAAALLVQRASERRLTRRLVQANAEAAALERIANSSRAVRDRMNTPLQTLALALELLERSGDDHTHTPELIQRMRRALVKLTELSARLAAEEPRTSDGREPRVRVDGDAHPR